MTSEMSSASFLINQREAGIGLDDKKMVQLTDSIQGLFDAESLALSASPAKVAASAPARVKVASKLAAPKVQKTVATRVQSEPAKASGKKVLLVQMSLTAPVQPKGKKSVAPKVPKTWATVQREGLKAVAPKVSKAVAKLVQAKAVKVVAPKVQKSGTGLVQPKTVKPRGVLAKVQMAVAAPVQPKAMKSVVS